MTYKNVCECDSCKKQYVGKASNGYNGSPNAPKHWLRVKINGSHYHFCTYNCLATWASEQKDKEPEVELKISVNEARKVGCPKCGAVAGEKCKIVEPGKATYYYSRPKKRGTFTNRVHKARKVAALEAKGGKKKAKSAA